MRLNVGMAGAVFFFCLLQTASAGPTGPGGPALRSDVSARAPAVTSTSAPVETPVPADPVALLAVPDQGVDFEFRVRDYSLADTPEGACLDIPGAFHLSAPGEFDLPACDVLVGVPQHGQVWLSVSGLDTETLHEVRLRPAPGFGPDQPAPSDDAADAFVPGSPAELIEVITLRDVRVARIRLTPARYNPARRTVELHRNLRVSVRFEQPGLDNRHPDSFDPVLAEALVNPDQALAWKLAPPPGQDTANFFDRFPNWFKVKPVLVDKRDTLKLKRRDPVVRTAGLYRLTWSQLGDAGVPVAQVDPRTFHLYAVGPYAASEHYPDTMIEIPVYITGEDDGSFDKEDFIVFYDASPSRWNSARTEWIANPFALHSAFWLTWGGPNGRRFETVSGAGAQAPASTALNRVHLETDNTCPARSGLLWFWREITKESGLEARRFEFALDLPNLETFDSLTLRLYARTKSNTARILLNGVDLGSYQVLGAPNSPPAITVRIDSIPAEAARPGIPDTLVVELTGNAQMEAFLDWVEIDYTERLTVSSEQPQLRLVTGQEDTAEFAIDGADTDVLLLDVTDPWAPRRIVDLGSSQGRRTARVPVSGPTVFLCVNPDRTRDSLTIEKRNPGRLRSMTEQADYYIICPDEFIAAGRMYARYRQGNVADIPNARVRAVALSDIYDDYGFGMEEPLAIKEFLAAKRPDYGLLAGDATYDYKDNLGTEHPPYVPAYEVGYDIEPNVYQSAAQAIDSWYADHDGSGSGPDMVLARLTCRSENELRRFLDKVRAYETQPPGFWTKRFLLLADDEWEGQGKSDPIGFAHIGGCENIILHTRGLLDPVKIYLTEYPFTGQFDKSGARRELLERLRQGALFWCFFGHGAGFQLCHEVALHISGVPEVEGGTHNPIAFFGSCGVGRFEDTKYESVAEELARKEQGCIATMGATKATTPGGNEYFAQELFRYLVDHPEEPVGRGFYQAWLTNHLYHLFGDPATMHRLPRFGVEPTVEPDTFYPGGVVTAIDSVPVNSGRYGLSVHEADWFRNYYSERGSVRYYLPGYELHTASGTFGSGQARCRFTVPTIDYPDTVNVPNGSYIRLPNTSSVSFLCSDGAYGYSSKLNTIPLADTLLGEDASAPAIMLYVENRALVEADTVPVPGRFNLVGVIEDESGILLAPPDSGPSFYIGARTEDRTVLTNRFAYDRNSCTRGRFSYPVEIDQEVDSITVNVADNLRNRRLARFFVRTQQMAGLTIDSCLVYPNPAQSRTMLTFRLNRSAFVSARIYTISGRLVRSLPARPCGFGFNMVEWDGLDANGRVPANGVYLYKLEGRSSELVGDITQTWSASFQDKFLIHR